MRAILVPLLLLGGCAETVADLDCTEVTGKAKSLSEEQETEITALANVSETSRTKHDLRCSRPRDVDDNETRRYVREYDEGETRWGLSVHAVRSSDGPRTRQAAIELSGRSRSGARRRRGRDT